MPAYSSDILKFRGILKWGEAFGEKKRWAEFHLKVYMMFTDVDRSY